MATVTALAQRCEGAHRDKQGWRAKCPVHQGQSDTSLHLWEEQGQLQVHCFAGCHPKDILDWLGVAKQPRREDVYEALYSYHDERGNLLYQVVRKPGKKFVQRRPHPTQPGEWVWDMKGVTRVLYRLPEVLQAVTMQQPIYLVEGEKDVETLRSHGLVATCNVGGAVRQNKAKTWEDSYNATLQNAQVIILPDNDEAGQDHAAVLSSRLRGFVRSLSIVSLPDLPDKGDVTDWLQAGNTIEDLKALAKSTKPTIVAPHLVVTKLADIEPEEITWLWHPYLPLGKLTLLEGDPGQGKTYLMLAVAAAVTKGYNLPDQRGRVAPPHGHAGHVLYLTAEDGLADTIRPRAEKADADLQRLSVVEGWTAGGELEQFSFAQLALLGEVIRDLQIKLVIIDPIQAFLGANVDMHRANEVRPLMAQLGRLASVHHCCILAIRHITKGNGKALYRGLGSIDFTAAARSVLVIAESLEDESKRVLAQAKNSLDAKGASIVFQITDDGFMWCGTSRVSADELLSQQPTKHQHQRSTAKEWLRHTLQNRELAQQTIEEEARANGIGWRTIERAKAELGVIAFKTQGRWYWKLPGSVHEPWDMREDDDDAF